jgi:hypothetical protein
VNSASILVSYGNGLKGTGVGGYYDSGNEIIIIREHFYSYDNIWKASRLGSCC